MKKILLIPLLILSCFMATGQNRDEHREKIKALKTAHITSGMNFTPEEAQQFWPIYNEFQKKRRELYRKEHADIDNLQCMTEAEAASQLSEYVEIERQDFLLKKQFYNDLRKIFSAKRIMHLKQVEEEFNKKLMREYRARRERDKKQNQ